MHDRDRNHAVDLSDPQARISVLIPCYNEAPTIGKVVDDFRAQLPDARIVVFDNCCTDETARIAREHGADVIKEPRQGKGYVIERMFDQIDSDLYVMVDGDDTYPADCVQQLLEPVRSGDADMAVGARLADYTDAAFPRFHKLGNDLVRRLVNLFFRARLTDILSGYRAYNREVVRRIPIVSSGLEVETELTVQMLHHRRAIVEVPVPYRERPTGSVSKLRTIPDGARVLWTLFTLFRAIKPLTFFGGIGILLFLASLLAGFRPIQDYLTDPQHYVRHVPLAILATGLMLLSATSAVLGILLHAINWRFREIQSVAVR